MSLVLNTNVDALFAQSSLSSSGSQLSTALQQLSSGLRINTPADDAAGYAIVQGMTSQIGGLNQAQQNASNGVSLTQTAAGALQEVTNDLQSMRDLAVESLNATNSSTDRSDLDQQFQQLSADIENVATTSNFNGVNLLDGSFSGQVFQTGADAGQTVTVAAIASAKTGALGVYTGANAANATVTAGNASALSVQVGGSTYALGTIATDASDIAAALNSAGISGLTATANASSVVTNATAVSGASGDVDSFEINGVTINVTNTGTASGNDAAALAAINAVSAATGVTATSNGGGLTLSSQSGATIAVTNFTPGNLATIADYGLAAGTTTGTVNVSYNAPSGVSGNLVITGAGFTHTYAIGSTGTSIAASNILTTTNANDALASIDAALQAVATTGAQLGAYQNRFQAAVTGLTTDATNLTSARSTIEDTDYATATSDLSKAQILQQASTAMVAQANTIPQNVLTLLQHLP